MPHDRPFPAPRGIALVGPMASGKSSVGRALAARMELPFLDLDHEIARRGTPPATLLRERGEAAFRAVELSVLLGLGSGPHVLACGGGTPTLPSARAHLLSRYRTIFLDVPEEECARRAAGGPDRPLHGRAGLFESRRPVYASAHHVVDATGSVAAVVERIGAAVATGDEDLPGCGTCRIRPDLEGLGDLVRSLEPDGVVLATDSTVGPLHLGALQAQVGAARVVQVPAGEVHKTMESWARLVDGLLEAGSTRHTVVVALGGGVLLDLAGFAASVCHRGLRTVLVPTTTLAMIDASIGGKTAFNHARGKNLVGSFHPPAAVWMATELLRTLDPRHYRAGLAEAVKMAATSDATAVELLEALPAGLPHGLALEAVIRSAVRTKAHIVHADPREGGLRRVLNAGHTVGHALEASLGYGTWVHGEAVAAGLVLETSLGEALEITSPGTASRLAAILQRLGLPVELPADLDPVVFAAALALDKKKRCDMLYVPFVTHIGTARVCPLPPHTLIAGTRPTPRPPEP